MQSSRKCKSTYSDRRQISGYLGTGGARRGQREVTQGTGNSGVWASTLLGLQGWLQVFIHISKLIKLYSLSMYSSVYINDTAIKFSPTERKEKAA